MSFRFLVVPCLGKNFFKARQVLSIVFVLAPVSGSTKLTELLTVRWEKTSWFKELYAFQQSDMIVVSGKIFSLMIAIKLLAVRSATNLKKHSLVSLSISPHKPQTPSNFFPYFFFLFPNLDSSISTNFPGRPIFCCILPGYKYRLLLRSCISQR